ncbi:MAG TPA: T9SS type A sorting domain-containing protein [Bacteroidia bacterium]|nr:T9SS type A sorting domain-containing protein [Bacteroidia bacterium]
MKNKNSYGIKSMVSFTNGRTTFRKLLKNIIAVVLICFMAVSANGQAANLDQVRNGASSSPNNPGAWVNGNVNASQAHMVEGYSVAYRMVVTGLTTGAHRLDIAYQVRVGSKNGIDYLTHFSRLEPHITQFGHAAEVINPLIGQGLSSPSVVTFPIPLPNVTKIVSGLPQPQTSFNALPAAERMMTMYNGLAIDSITFLSVGSLNVASSSTTMRIWFRTTNAKVVFAWGGHIASQYDWGVGQSASSISGSPYHMSLVGIDGQGGSQDRALAAAAVVAPQCLISGPTSVCSGSTNSYTGPAGSGFTYSWAIINNTSGASFNGPSTGQTVSVNSGSSAGSFGLQITVSSGLSNSTCNITINVSGATSCSISPTGSVCPGSSRTYTAPAGNDTYQWSITGSGSIPGSSTGQSVTVAAGNACNGSYTLSLTVSKGVCSSSCSETISVIDNTAPTIGQPGQSGTISCPATPVFTAPTTASDGCDPNPQIQEVSDVTTPGICANVYSRTKTWRAVDACGNPSNTVSQTINVIDNTPPTISCPSAIVLGCNAEIPSPDPASVTASDNCAGNVTVEFLSDGTPTTNSACVETRIRTYRATDACGNTNTCTQSISRTVDTTPPVITCPADVTLNCNASTAPGNTGTATATDNCSVQVTFSDVTTSQNCFSYITRTWTATDLCGNTATCEQHIIKRDRTAPVINCQSTVSLSCGAAIPTPGVTDNCSSASEITIVFNDAFTSGGCPGSSNRTRTWTAIDASGNTSTCVQQISYVSQRFSNNGEPGKNAEIINSDLQISAYPNPFDSKVSIEFTPKTSSNVKLEIFNLNGEKISELYNGYSEAAKVYKFDFKGDDQAQGIYFYKLTSNGNTYMNKLILIKQ